MESQDPNQPIVPSASPAIKPSNHLAIIAMAMFMLLCLGSVIFLFYQNQQLKKMLAQYQVQNSPSPAPIATTDPTSDWKTYINEKYGFSFKYPTEFKTVIDKDKFITLTFESTTFDNPNSTLIVSPKYSNTFTLLKKCNIENTVYPCIARDEKMADITIDGRSAKRFIVVKNSKSIGGTYEVVQFYEPKIEIEMNMSGGEMRTTFDEILSTFKFLDNGQQVACTMEAKICPDGSSVGRTGPNCEFTPCPTP